MSTTTMTATILPKQIDRLILSNNFVCKSSSSSSSNAMKMIINDSSLVGAGGGGGGGDHKRSLNSSITQQNDDGDKMATEQIKPKRKRQRLDHLTQEQKVMRRKLKNRMAAQSARDRKKKKMMDLEKENNHLGKERNDLIKRNRYLEQKLKLYIEENDNLRKKLGIEPIKLEPESDDTMELFYSYKNSHIDDDDDDDDKSIKDDDNDVDDYDDDYVDGSDEDSYQSSDNYSSTSTANAFESAELINVPQPKVQVLAEKDGKMENVRQPLVTIDKTIGKQNHHQHQKSLKEPQMKTCSLQQLTNFLMVLLATISLNSNNNSSSNNNKSNSQSITEPIINLVLKQLSQIQLNNENYLQEMDLEFSQCLSELAKQCQLNTLIQQYQRKHVRLRI
ncbi:uncharacterized protein LOC124499800 [Dermatophagoides farinae]|uniref:uncharacterized protein LOC124499800 n=1 Tax=Dermatophagoides farinae TaxID=6954 RepID=UPI003F636959